jgi:NADPH2:quinone reductase
MRAVLVERHGSPDGCIVADVPTPEPKAGQILIEAKACGVNYPDLLVVSGRYQNLPARPFTPGKEVAGVVAKLGPGVAKFREGDRVMAQLEHGAWAEAVVSPAATAFKLPDEMDFPTAATMGLTYQTAHFALIERGRFRAGESVLVLGASGGVGLAAIELVKALGGRALAGIANMTKAEVVREAGADAVVDLAAPDLRDALRAQVFPETDGRGADIVIDAIGGAAFEAAIRALAWRGRIVVVGFAAGEIPTIRANYLLLKNIAASGLQWSDYRDREPQWVGRVQEELLQLWRQGKIHPKVAAMLPLERFDEALAMIRDRTAPGRLALIP